MLTQAPRTIENDTRESAATDRYNARYNNQLFIRATKNRTSWYANELIDAALQECGSPYFCCSPYVSFDQSAREFLAEFSK